MRQQKAGLNGLVLMGGHSRRMGEDKARLLYHEKPQYLHCYDLLKNHCEQVYLSCRINESFELPVLLDSDKYPEAGPMVALYTAFAFSSAPWLLLAVDYPLVDKPDLERLLTERDETKLASVYFNPESGFFEPFIGIYESSCAAKIQEALAQGRTSMQELLMNHPVKKVLPQDLSHIQSVDDPEQRKKLKQQLAHEKTGN